MDRGPLTDAESRRRDLARIEAALLAAGRLLAEYARRDLEVEEKRPGDPVTEADRAADALLRETLLAGSPAGEPEGWLSEETADDPVRLERRRVWIVDPLDGTREFVSAIPEWCVSIGLVEDGRPVAGGIYNPLAERLILGAEGLGVTLDGEPAAVTGRPTLDGATVLASRSEVGRGEWDRFEGGVFRVEPTGSVAYKLGLVAAGLADATWTLRPKNEWDVAGGAALVLAAGGAVRLPAGDTPTFNRPRPWLPGFLAANERIADALPGILR